MSAPGPKWNVFFPGSSNQRHRMRSTCNRSAPSFFREESLLYRSLHLTEGVPILGVTVRSLNFQWHGTQTAERRQTVPALPLSSVAPADPSGHLGCLRPWAPLSICLLCVSALAIHPVLAYNGNIDWPLTRPGQAGFAVIMNERCQWQSISFQIFLHIVNINFCKRDWAPNSLQS